MAGMTPSIHKAKITGLSPLSKVDRNTFVTFDREDGGRVHIPPDQIMRLWNERLERLDSDRLTAQIIEDFDDWVYKEVPGYGSVAQTGPSMKKLADQFRNPPTPHQVKRVLVVEIPILETDHIVPRTATAEPPTLDVLHVSAVTSQFAESIVQFHRDLDPQRFRIEERP